MRTIWNKWFLLMDTAGDGNGAGGAGGTVLTTSQSGGGAQANQGSTNTGGTQGEGAQGAAGANGTSSNQGGTATSSWRDSLSAELREEPSLKVHNDIGSLVKSYIHAQKAIGADKIVIPGKHATEDDWKQVYGKLGLPKDLKEYEIKLEGDMIDKEFAGKFKETAYKAGILPKQAQQLADWFQEVNKSSAEEVKKQREAKVKTDLENLQKEWGAAYQQNLTKAAKLISEINDPALNEYLDKTGLGNDIQFIKLCQRVADKYLGEDSTVGGNQTLQAKLTPAQAHQEINKIMGNGAHPYFDKNHPNHKAAVAEVQDLFNATRPQA